MNYSSFISRDFHLHSYDKSNQLLSSTTDGKTTQYAYDAAGRLVKEGNKTYSYGYLDKILEVQENGEQIAAFDYHVDGQIAQATHGDKTENFIWDGLALIHRGDNSFVNEPYVTGGNPILSSKDGVMFNDILGTTLGIKNEQGFEAINMTAFGEPKENNADKVGFFTGKPYIGELGYAFLFRNYRADQGKWQTKDPLGYPDGWNNLAYVNNKVSSSIDFLGGWTVEAHNLIIAGQFSEMSSSDIAAIQAGSTYVDRLWGGQGSSTAYQHSMRNDSQTPAQAIVQRDAFIAQTLSQANNLIDTDRTVALGLMGQALHTIQDSFCPLHVDTNGDPIEWDPISWGAIGHMMGNEGPDDLTQGIIDNIARVTIDNLINYQKLARAITE